MCSCKLLVRELHLFVAFAQWYMDGSLCSELFFSKLKSISPKCGCSILVSIFTIAKLMDR